MSVNRSVLFRVPHKWKAYVVGAIVLASALVRLWGIFGRGIYYHDEAHFVANGRFHAGLIRYALGEMVTGSFDPSSLVEQARLLQASGGARELRARPLHELSLIALTLVFGSATRAGPLLSALAGVATVLLLAVTDWKQGYLAGIVAALLLAVSAWHTHYSRSALSQALSLLLVVVVMYAMSRYQRGERHVVGQLRWIGLLTGLAFATHYNLFWLPLLTGGWLAWNEWEGPGSVLPWLGRMIQVAGMMMLPLVCFGVIYRIDTYMNTYLGQLAHQLGYTDQIASVGVNPSFILKTLMELEGMPFLLCMLAGLLYLTWRALRKDRFALLLLLWVLIPGVIWTVFGYPAPRSYLPVLPPLLLGAGLLVQWLWRSVQQKRKSPWPVTAIVCIVLGIVLVSQFVRLQPLIQARSPWRAAAEQIIAYRDSHPGSRVDDAELTLLARPIYRYYLGEIVSEEQTGGNLFIVDFATRLQPDLEDKIRRVESLCTPIASVAGDLDAGMIMVDMFSPSDVTQYRSRPAYQRIDVYDLERCGEQEG